MIIYDLLSLILDADVTTAVDIYSFGMGALEVSLITLIEWPETCC